MGLEEIAAIAAGMFAVLDPATPVKNGNGGATSPVPSQWKQKGHAEALR